MNLDVAMTFLDFIVERHVIWEKRQAGEPQPWTDDPVLASRKFTNVFRVLDPGSQFVFELAQPNDDPRDVLMRLFLYRHTNLPSAWRAYAAETGGYPAIEDLDDLQYFWKDYRAKGGKIFSGAYMIYPQSPVPGTDKVESVIDLTWRLFDHRSPAQIVLEFLKADTQAERFACLRRNKGVADFMSQQILTDFGYTPQCGEDLENEFVVPGPGAVRGAKYINPSAKPLEVIQWARRAVLEDPRCPELALDEYGENYRVPSLMDCQNCCCELSKYLRFIEKPVQAQPYRPAHPGPQPKPVLPQHW